MLTFDQVNTYVSKNASVSTRLKDDHRRNERFEARVKIQYKTFFRIAATRELVLMHLTYDVMRDNKIMDILEILTGK
jgi:hypothetical protein